LARLDEIAVQTVRVEVRIESADQKGDIDVDGENLPATARAGAREFHPVTDGGQFIEKAQAAGLVSELLAVCRRDRIQLMGLR